MRKILMAIAACMAGYTLTAQAQGGRFYAPSYYEGSKVADEGAWCWFADPRALHYENEAGTINCSYVGYIDVHGAVKAVQYDFLKKRRTEVMIRSYFQPDDHNNPTFLMLPDERVMIFYSRHTDEPCFYYRISEIPGDITTLGDEKVIATRDNTTYPSPFILSDDPEHIYLCWRGINWHPTIARLTLPDGNDDVTIDWGPYQMVQSSGARPYAKYHSNGKDRIMFVYTTGHPDNENPNWLYLNQVNIHTKQLEDVQGRVLSNIADGPHRVTRTEQYATDYPQAVVDHTPGVRDWVWQVAADEEGRPAVAIVKINGDKSRHDYYYKYWDGEAWKEIFLAHGGGHFHQTPDIEHCYSGGMALDPSQPTDVYCSVPDSNQTGVVYELVKYKVNKETGEVTQRKLTYNSHKNNVRPYILPHSENSPMRLLWMHGDYYDWIVSSERPGYPTSIHGGFYWEKEPLALLDGIIAKGRSQEGTTWKPGQTQKVKVPGENRKGDFSVVVAVKAGDEPTDGKICEGDGWAWSTDSASMKPVLTVHGVTVRSSNVLASADSWLHHGRGTNGKWYPAEPYTQFMLAVVYENGRLMTYVDGLADRSVAGDFSLDKLTLGGSGGIIDSFVVYDHALNPAEIGYLASQYK